MSVENTLYRRLVDIFHQSAFAEIQNPDSKLRTYSILKTKTGCENYLTKILSINDRKALTKFRLSNHSLMIEKGRHLGVNKDARFCNFCLDKVEDEMHFLLNCKTFKLHRRKLFEKANENLRYFYRLNDKAKFIALLNNPKLTLCIGKYLCRTMELRDFLLQQHKNND